MNLNDDKATNPLAAAVCRNCGATLLTYHLFCRCCGLRQYEVRETQKLAAAWRVILMAGAATQPLAQPAEPASERPTIPLGLTNRYAALLERF